MLKNVGGIDNFKSIIIESAEAFWITNMINYWTSISVENLPHCLSLI